MKLARLLLSRLVQGALLVLAVIVLNFVLVHAAPGDPWKRSPAPAAA